MTVEMKAAIAAKVEGWQRDEGISKWLAEKTGERLATLLADGAMPFNIGATQVERVLRRCLWWQEKKGNRKGIPKDIAEEGASFLAQLLDDGDDEEAATKEVTDQLWDVKRERLIEGLPYNWSRAYNLPLDFCQSILAEGQQALKDDPKLDFGTALQKARLAASQAVREQEENERSSKGDRESKLRADAQKRVENFQNEVAREFGLSTEALATVDDRRAEKDPRRYVAAGALRIRQRPELARRPLRFIFTPAEWTQLKNVAKSNRRMPLKATIGSVMAEKLGMVELEPSPDAVVTDNVDTILVEPAPVAQSEEGLLSCADGGGVAN